MVLVPDFSEKNRGSDESDFVGFMRRSFLVSCRHRGLGGTWSQGLVVKASGPGEQKSNVKFRTSTILERNQEQYHLFFVVSGFFCLF